MATETLTIPSPQPAVKIDSLSIDIDLSNSSQEITLIVTDKYPAITGGILIPRSFSYRISNEDQGSDEPTLTAANTYGIRIIDKLNENGQRRAIYHFNIDIDEFEEEDELPEVFLTEIFTKDDDGEDILVYSFEIQKNGDNEGSEGNNGEINQGVISRLIDDKITAVNIPGLVDERISNAGIPELIDKQISDSAIPDLIDQKITAINIPAIIDAEIDEAAISNLIDEKITAADIPGKINTRLDEIGFDKIIDDKISQSGLGDLKTRLTELEGRIEDLNVVVTNNLNLAGKSTMDTSAKKTKN